jgi:predicted nucleic acid-binding protein
LILLVDTNVLLDVLARRAPFYEASAQVWSLAERGAVEAYISSISFNNVYYIVRKASGRQIAQQALQALRDVFDWVAPDRNIINQAVDFAGEDFEDSVQFCSAVRVQARYLVTRDPAGFPTTGPAVVTPTEFLALVAGDAVAGLTG